MVALNELYQVRDIQTQTSEILNVYGYLQTTAGSLAAPYSEWSQALANVFRTSVLDVVRTMQTNVLTHVRIEVINLNDPSDFTTLAVGAAGTVTATAGTQPLPPWFTADFRFNRATRAVRHGHKRISGIPESHQDQGNLEPSQTALYSSVANAMALTLTIQGAAFQPVIIRSTRLNAGIQPPVYSHGYFPIAGVQFSRFGTQNSRKR